MTDSSQTSTQASGWLWRVLARTVWTVVTVVVFFVFLLIFELIWTIGGVGSMPPDDQEVGLVPFVPVLIAMLTLTLTIVLSKHSAKRRPWYTIVVLVGVATCVYLAYAGYREDDLTIRSRAVEGQVRLAFPDDGDTAPLTLLMPAASMKDDPPSFICIVTPYESAEDIPELAGLDFGDNSGWLTTLDESWIGVVALDARGGIASIVRLSRAKVDLRRFTAIGRCYQPSDAKLVRIGTSSEGAVLLTIQSNDTVP